MQTREKEVTAASAMLLPIHHSVSVPISLHCPLHGSEVYSPPWDRPSRQKAHYYQRLQVEVITKLARLEGKGGFCQPFLIQNKIQILLPQCLHPLVGCLVN